MVCALAFACALAAASRAEAGLAESVGDPGLNYFALGLLISVIVIMVYGMVAIHDIPARIAESRHHPHADAIHAAGWVSLFTLHVLWPFLWIWAMAYKPDRGWGFSTDGVGSPAAEEIRQLQLRLDAVETQLKTEKGRSNVQKLKIKTGDKD